MKKALVMAFILLGILGAWAQSSDKPAVAAATAAPNAGAAPGVIPLNLSPYSIQVSPTLNIPLGDSTNFFTLGGGGSVTGQYRMPFLPQALARVGLEYGYSANPGHTTVSFTSAKVGVGYSYNFIPNLGVEAHADGGATYGFINGDPKGYWNPYVTAGLDVYWVFPPAVTLNLGTSFLYQIGLYTGVGVSLGASIGLGTPVTVQKFEPESARPQQPRPQLLQGQPGTLKPGTGLQLSKVSISDVYPVFYKFYDDHPIGSVVLHNYEKSAVQNVKVSVFVKEYMTDPKETRGPDKIASGADASVDLFGLFTKDILANTEATKVTARVTLQYTLNGKDLTQDSVQTLQVLRRNSLTWDDDRKAAAFVSANDPTAVRFAKNVQSMVQGKASATLEPNLLLAMAMHDALTLFGLTYSTDPVATLNSDNKTVDYIQFPQQTLDYKGGKCSDFSVLYASMFEAVGVETAFITIPGHIYMAVALQMSPDEARKTFQNSDDFIYQGNKVWLPIEITLREGGFQKAWQLGAKEWRENVAKKQAGFYPLHEAWNMYQPVGYSSTDSNVAIPQQDKLVKVYTDEVNTFVTGQIGRQEAALLAAVNKAANKSKPLNSLAVLYSRYGLFDKAQKSLLQVLAKEEYVPALINIGNIYFVQSHVDKALEFYNRAYKKDPNSPTVLLCVARANHALENYSIAKKAYQDLQNKDPELAQKFAYLDLRGEEATRAADQSQVKKVVIWQD